ncbi:MAG TPA: hypothetical protein DCE78_00840 [Bacteroidetes bacterium]|nr:hypothetical protein [Bacteroidota bacterium]
MGVDREWEEKHKHRKMRSLLTDIESESEEVHKWREPRSLPTEIMSKANETSETEPSAKE